jgi:hypothetical protein
VGTAREERAFSHPTLLQLQVDFKWLKNLIQSPLSIGRAPSPPPGHRRRSVSKVGPIMQLIKVPGAFPTSRQKSINPSSFISAQYGEREERYSDWLAWIFGEIGAVHVLALLFKQPPSVYGSLKTVKREECVPKGNHGHSGRLDIVLRFDSAIIVVEVKMLRVTKIEKHQGYLSWLCEQPEKNKRAFLIAVDTSVDESAGFALLFWNTLLTRIWRLLPRLIKDQRIILAAVMGAFVGAVEQNLLGYPALGNYGSSLFGTSIDSVAAYLETTDG